MSTVPDADRAAACHLQERLGWPEFAYPTPEQLVAYLRECPESVALEVAGRMITASQDAANCWRANHKFEVEYLRSVVAALHASGGSA